MIIKINDEFIEKGLTLEEAYILARVQHYEESKTQCIESNLTLAKAMGKSESTARRAIENLIEKGYLNRSIVKNTRILSIEQVVHIEQGKESRMRNEEFRQFLQIEIQKNKSRYNDSDEEFY